MAQKLHTPPRAARPQPPPEYRDEAEAYYVPTPAGLVEVRQVMPGRWQPVAVQRTLRYDVSPR